MNRTPGRPLRLVHTSDVHMGSDDAEIARHAFKAVVEVTQNVRADALLLAGDIFDHNRVPDREVAFLLQQVGRLDVPVVLLPGNHDAYDETSVYRRPIMAEAPPNLHVLGNPQGYTLTLPDLDLTVWGRATYEHTEDFHPLAGVPPRNGTPWYVGMAHGHFHEPGTWEHRASPIQPEEIATAPCDYLAFGHWDRFADVSQGGVPAYYSGAPYNGWRRGGGLTNVVLATLTPGQGLQITRLPLE